APIPTSTTAPRLVGLPSRIPARLPPCTNPTHRRSSLQIGHLGAIAQLAERLDRTQEVGGSNPPSSIASNPLQTGTFASALPLKPPLDSQHFWALVPKIPPICGDRSRFRGIAAGLGKLAAPRWNVARLLRAAGTLTNGARACAAAR